MQNSVETMQSNPLAPRRAEDVAYRALTLAAILLILGSLWLF